MSALLPTNIEAEEAILGGIMIDPLAIARIANLLKAEAFAITAHQIIYTKALELHFRGQIVDLMTLTSALADAQKLEDIGGQAKMSQLAERTVSAVNIDQYALIVVDKFIRRKAIHLLNESILLAYDTSIELDAVITQIETKVFSLNKLKPNQSTRPAVRIEGDICHDIADNFEQIIEDRNNGVETNSTIYTGFYDFDSRGGLPRSTLTVIGARASMGKSALMSNICHNVARDGKRVLIFSLEMSGEDIVIRELASQSRIPFANIKQADVGNLENGFTRLSNAIGQVSGYNLFIDDTCETSVNLIKSRCREFVSNHGPLDLVAIDYLQLLVDGSGGENNVNAFMSQKLTDATRQFKFLAQEINAPVILLSQIARSVESTQDKRPMLSHLASSSGIENNADIVLMLYRESYYNPNCENPDDAELIVAKGRNMAKGTIQLLFDAPFMTFRNKFTPNL